MLPWATAPRLRERQHWLACALRACASAHSLAAVGAAARAYTLRRCCCVWRIEVDTALANVCICFVSAPPRRMTHTEATFSGDANFRSTCITHTRQAAQDDVIRDAAMGHGAAAVRTAQHWLACALRACAGAHSLAAVGAAARAYTLRRCCCVCGALSLILRSLTRVCASHPLLRAA